MEIACHISHLFMPATSYSGARPIQPITIFKAGDALKYQLSEQDRMGVPAGTFFESHWLYPIFMGLYHIDDLKMLGHISIIFQNCGKGQKFFRLPERVWVQITTHPCEYTGDGIPVVVKDDKLNVRHIWGGNNGTRTPLGLLDSSDLIAKGKVAGQKEGEIKFWRDFFLEQIRTTEIKEALTAKRA